MRELFALFVSEQEKGETNYEKESNFLSACRDYDRIACGLQLAVGSAAMTLPKTAEKAVLIPKLA